MTKASAEKLEFAGPAEKKRVASVPEREQLASTPEPPLPKEEQSRQSRAADREGERVKVSESRTLAKERGIGVDSTVKKGQAKRTSLGEVEGSMSGWKSSPGRSAESWFRSKSGQTRDGKGGWETSVILKGLLTRKQSEMSQDDL